MALCFWIYRKICKWAFAFAIALSIFSTTAKDRLHWSPDAIGIGYLVWGIVGIFVQMWLIRRLLPHFGEVRLVMAVGFGILAVVSTAQSAALIWPAVIMTSLGDGLINPSFNGLLSKIAHETELGRIQGGNQAVQSLARVVGPIWGGTAYQQIGFASPFSINPNRLTSK